ncbi:MotB family protein [Mesorhizobium xinjiangense]|uniref:MotB family protein n=1 Tax=Mesorhizobium xinjiangense TaxID=2678685 RepID=UPI0012EEB2C1|nr:MotB family protein [Mesorhizobium xinjiangense]
MNVSDTSERPQEIIIVKHRRSDDEDGHHGGVWKIAFADFMTAMMCFFLVMWLINASNEETRLAVASYFNPIKLVDRNTSRRGLEEAGSGVQAEDGGIDVETRGASAADAGAGETAAARSRQSDADAERSDAASDEHLFADPYAVLAEIAAESGELQNLSPKGDGGAQDSGPATGASGGEQYRDPFAPDFWSTQVEQDEPGAPSLYEVPQSPTPTEGTRQDQAASDTPDGAPAADTPEEAVEPDTALATAVPEPQDDEAPPAPDERENAPQPAANDKAQQIAREMREELARAFPDKEKILAGISIMPADRGIMISLTDQLDYGMFQIGSAVPRRELVLAMEKIAAILDGRSGAIKIQGHTDARPFRSGDYDNWRLSTARAHSAYYMLVRAGLDEQRIVVVAGFADRKLKEPDDPMAAANRRIEILLEVDG